LTKGEHTSLLIYRRKTTQRNSYMTK